MCLGDLALLQGSATRTRTHHTLLTGERAGDMPATSSVFVYVFTVPQARCAVLRVLRVWVRCARLLVRSLALQSVGLAAC